MNDLVPYWWLLIAFALGCLLMWFAMREVKPVLSHEQHKNAVDRIVELAREEYPNVPGAFYDRVRELMDELHRYEEEGAVLVSLSKEMLEIVVAVTNKKNNYSSFK
jgi:hypothetical protein